MATVCNAIYNETKHTFAELVHDKRSSAFMLIATAVLLLIKNSETWPATPKKLEEALSNNEIVIPEDIKNKVHRALDVTRRLLIALDHRRDIKSMEVLFFIYYVAESRRTRSLQEFTDDWTEMRRYFAASAVKRYIACNTTYAILRQWMVPKLARVGAMQAPSRRVRTYDETELADEYPEERDAKPVRQTGRSFARRGGRGRGGRR